MTTANADDSKWPRKDIVIAGGGTVGLTLALSLATSLGPDLSIGIIESAAPGEGGDVRAWSISAASRRLFEALGVWPAIEPDAQPVLAIELTDSPLDAGVRPVLLTYDNRIDGGEPASFIVPTTAITAALDHAVARFPSIHRIDGRANGLAQLPGAIAVTLTAGGSIPAALAIAADGRRSQLRDAAGIRVVAWPYDQIGIVTRVIHERPHNATAVQHFLPAGPFAILPLRDDAAGRHRSAITWSEGSTRGRDLLAMPDDAFLMELDLRFGGRLGALALDGARQSWPLEMHHARAYVADRLALIGDAAHGVHPIAGQGLNLALRDVAALTECIADAMRSGLDAGDMTALSRYERWRRFDSALSSATFDGLNRLFSRDWTLLRSAREAGLGIVDRMPALKRLFVTEAAGLSGTVPKLLTGLVP